MVDKTSAVRNLPQYEKELGFFLSHIISKKYLPNCNKSYVDYWVEGSELEFIIRPQCNQKCKYCYITQFGEQLYPVESRGNNDTILNNLKLMLDYLISTKTFICNLNLFAGDLFYDDLIYSIFDSLITNYYSKLPQQRPLLKILIPTNGRYLTTDKHQDLIRKYTNSFRDLGVSLKFSLSTDGPFGVDSREQTSEVNNEYYNKLFKFASEMGYRFHPMVSPENVEHWVDNLHWWEQMCKQFDIKNFKNDIYPYHLEVRNDGWTDDKIKFFKNGLRVMWHSRLAAFQGDALEMARHVFAVDGYSNIDILSLIDKCGPKRDSHLSCHANNELFINIMDLSIPFCHRLAYPQFTAGQFIVEDNKIVGIQPYDNAHSWIELKMSKPILYPKCEQCEYKFICPKGCLGSQYEYSGEVLYPIPSVCELEKAHINTLIELINVTGVLNTALENELLQPYPFLKQFLIEKSREMGYIVNEY